MESVKKEKYDYDKDFLEKQEKRKISESIRRNSTFVCVNCGKECSGLGNICEDCCKNEEHLFDYEKRKLREINLEKAMAEYSMTIRSDSELCRNYTYHGEEDVNYVVIRMAQMKYLFEYCDFRKVLNNFKQKSRSDIFGNFHVFDKAEKFVLEQIKEYPKVFPWLENDKIKLKNKKKIQADEEIAIEKLKENISVNLELGINTTKCNFCDSQSNFIVNMETDHGCDDCGEFINIEKNVYICGGCNILGFDYFDDYYFSNKGLTMCLFSDKNKCSYCRKIFPVNIKIHGIQIKKVFPWLEILYQIIKNKISPNRILSDEKEEIL